MCAMLAQLEGLQAAHDVQTTNVADSSLLPDSNMQMLLHVLIKFKVSLVTRPRRLPCQGSRCRVRQGLQEMGGSPLSGS